MIPGRKGTANSPLCLPQLDDRKSVAAEHWSEPIMDSRRHRTSSAQPVLGRPGTRRCTPGPCRRTPLGARPPRSAHGARVPAARSHWADASGEARGGAKDGGATRHGAWWGDAARKTVGRRRREASRGVVALRAAAAWSRVLRGGRQQGRE